jgi:hypothetical protein
LCALKAACALLGIGSGIPARPLLPASPVQQAAIRAILTRQQLSPADTPHD